MSEPSIPPTAVVVAILRDPHGHVLLSRRPEGARYPLKWEFPGGKVHPGESETAALARELAEELGITPTSTTLFHRSVASYADGGTFAVSFYIVERWIGTPRPLAAAALEWVAPDRLAAFDVLEGSRDVCALLATT